MRTIILVVLFALGACAGPTLTTRLHDQIISGDIAGRFALDTSILIDVPEAVQLVALDGRDALAVTLKYEWEAADLDWKRNGLPGYAQRIQFGETPGARMDVGREYWYTGRFYIPTSMPIVSGYVVSLMDFKHLIGEFGSTPTVSLNLQEDGNLKLIESLSSNWNCGSYTNVEGEQSRACDYIDSVGVIGSQRSFSGRWVQFVVQANWSRSNDGVFRFWLDGRPIFQHSGDTVQLGKQVEYKFGPYRRDLTPTTPDTLLYFADFARSNSCRKLMLVDCDALDATTRRDGFQNVRRVEQWVSNELEQQQRRAVQQGR